MRIGEFAKVNQTTIDTLRHYMALNLISPQKCGSQFIFDSRCQEDFEEILRLKAFSFSLQDIQTILLFRRVGKLSGYEKGLYYQSLFKDKAASLQKDIEGLKESLSLIQDEISKFEQSHTLKYSFGMPLEALSLLACQHCQKPLTIASGTLENGQVINGVLNCACGQTYRIDNGILMTESALHSKSDHGMIDDVYLENYIQNTDYDYLLNIYKSYEWIYAQPSIALANSKYLLELGIGHGFFLRLLSDRISQDAVYVGVDRDLNRLKWLRNRFLHTPPPFKLLLIAADFREMPLKYGGFDTLLDLSGSSNYAFEHEDFILSKAKMYLTSHAQLLASFLLFKNFSPNSKIAHHLRHQFTADAIESHLIASDFQPLLTFETRPVKRGGIFESYFVEGEAVYSKLYYCHLTST